jgi:hypothetical protein
MLMFLQHENQSKFLRCPGENPPQRKNEAREIPTPNLLIWSQTRCRCAIAPYECTALGRRCREWVKLLTCEPVAGLL